MQPTPRLVLLLALAAPLGALGGAAAAVAPLLVLAALLAAAADWLLGGDVARVRARRDVEPKLSLGDWNPVHLVLESGLRRSARVEVRDVPPSGFGLRAGAAGSAEATEGVALEAPLFHLDLPARGAAESVYRVRPAHRGDYTFGDLYLRLSGPLGLVRRQRRLAGSGASVRVYPGLRDLRRYDLQARRGVLQEAGAHAQRTPGASTEFERLREYVPDDDVRRVNWKATARRGRPIVNQYEAERSQNLVVMLDAGRLMAAPAGLPAQDPSAALVADAESAPGLTKLDHALNAALLLGHVASLRGDRVALLVYADAVRAFLPPARGRRAFLTMMQAVYNVAAEPVEPDHGLAFQFLATRNLRRSLVVLFTDVADRESSERLVAHLFYAGRHHQVVCVTLDDPTVVAPAVAVPLDAQGLYEKMVAQRLLEERAEVLARLARRGVLTLDTPADRLSPRLIGTYLDLKRRGRV